VLKSNTAALMLAQRAPGETAFGCVHQPTNQPEDDRDDVAASKAFCAKSQSSIALTYSPEIVRVREPIVVAVFVRH
jgi:hypothetical protein